MAYWLFKSEPGAWSWDDQVRSGVDTWDGVRNHQACNNMRAMRVGDRGFFYHSVNEKRIVGVVEVAKEFYPDPSDASGKFGMVDVKALHPVKSPVTLADLKADSRFEDFALIRQSRLSVVPVSDAHWAMISEMAGVDP